jgi:hypothetical protein
MIILFRASFLPVKVLSTDGFKPLQPRCETAENPLELATSANPERPTG